MNLKDFRAQYPQYNSIPDADLAKRLHDRYYSDIPFDEFSAQIGLTASTPQASQKLQADAFGGLTANPDSRLSGLTTTADEVSGKMTPASQMPRGREPLSESQKSRVAEATSADYGRVVSPTSDTGVPIREELPPVARQEAQRLLAQETDPAKRLVLQDELKRPTSARQPIELSPEEQAFAAEQATGRTAQDQLSDPEGLTAPTGPEVSAGSVGSGLLSSLGQGAELTRQGVRSQFADIIGSEAMQQDALTKAGRVRNAIEDSTPMFESPTAAAAYSGLSSFVQQVPGLAAAIAAGNPVPALAAAGLQTEAEAYTRYRDRGATPTEALTGAVGEGAVEVLTEMMPMGVLVNKLGKTGTKNFLTEFLAREAPGEQVATLAQDALDTAIANPDKTWGEYVAERPNAAWNTLVATAAMGGAVGGVNVAANALSRAAQLQQKADQAQSMITSAQSVDEALAGFNALSETLSQGAVDVSTINPVASVPTGSSTGGDLVSKRGVPDLLGGGVSGPVYAGPDGADAGGVRGDLQTGYVGDAGSQQPASVDPGEDWEAFPVNSSLGIPRAEMPQIKTEHRGAMVNFLNARGVTHTEEDVDPGTLLPSQQEYSPSKVAKAADSDRAILISKDNRVLDGHHQWLARMQSGEPVRAIRLNGTAEELLPQLKEFPSSTQESGATEVVEPMDDLVLPAETSAQESAAARTGVQSLPGTDADLSVNSENTISNSGVQSAAPTSEVLPDEQPTETAAPAGRVLPGTDSGTSTSRAGSVRIAELGALARRRGNEAGATDLGAISVSPASQEDLLALPRGTRGSVESVAKAFGQNVVWYKPSEAAKAYVPDGFVVRGKADEADTIYLSVDGSVSPTRTAYHEVLHQLRNDAPDVYDEFSAAIRPLIDEAQAMRVSVQEANRSPDGRDGTQALGDEVYFEELAADIFSDSAHKPEFWLDVADRMTGEVASRFFKLINTLLERVKAALSSDRTFNSDSYVKDLEAARKAAAKAAARYYIRQKQRGKADLRNAVRTADQTAAEVLESPRRKTEPLGDFTYSRDKVGGITVFGDAQDIRSLLPDGVVGRVVKDGLAFTPADAPRVKGALSKKAPGKPVQPRKAKVVDEAARVEQNGGYGLTSSDIQKLPDAERSAFAESIEAAFRLRGAKGSVLGLSISREFEAQGFTSLIGKRISGPEDLAIASQVYRDPRFETIHYVFLQHGEVVGHRAVSSRMAGFSYVVPSAYKDLESYWTELAEQASSLGEGVTIALLHNHPSGDPTPSEADFRLTERAKSFFGGRSIPLFGHVIINHQKYALIDKDIDAFVRNLEFQDTYNSNNPSAPHALLGKAITSQQDLAEHFRASRVSEDNILLLGANGLSGVSLVMEIEPSDLGDAKLGALLRKVSRETGSDTFFAVNVPERMLARAQAAYKKGFFVDVIMQKAYGQENLSLNAVGLSRMPEYRMGRTSEVTREIQQPRVLFSNRRQTDTPEFKRWAGTDNPVIPGNEINYTDFSGPGPFVLQAFHGTTHSFSVFDASQRGNKEGQFGAVNYFTSSEQDAADNYAGIGPDLTSRLDNLRERLEQDFEGLVDDGYSPDDIASEINQRYELDLQALDVPRVDNELDGPIDPYALASDVAQRVLNGGEEIVMEVFVKTERPFVAGDPERSPWFEFFDEARIEAQALERVADNEGLSTEDIEADRETYEDALEDARYEIMDEQENPLIAAVQTVADRYDFDPSGVLASIYDVTADGTVSHNKLEDELRYLLDRKYVQDPETGDLISNHVLAEVIQELGFDSIILKNADRRFRNMNMEPGTAHIHVFDANNTNIKSATDNNGQFDPENPDIRYSNRRQPQLGDQLPWQEFKQYLRGIPARDSFGRVSAAEKGNWAAAAGSWTLKALDPKTLEPTTAEAVDISKPIIVGTDGDVIDGRNRLAEAINAKAPAIAAWVGSDQDVPAYTPDTSLVDLFKAMKSDARLMPKSVRNKVEAHPLAAEIRNVQDNFLDILEQLETDGLVKINC